MFYTLSKARRCEPLYYTFQLLPDALIYTAVDTYHFGPIKTRDLPSLDNYFIITLELTKMHWKKFTRPSFIIYYVNYYNRFWP